MKCSPAISFGMPASRRTAKPSTPRMVGAEYGLMLRTIAEETGGWGKAAGEAGISSVSAWRLTKGKGTMKSALAMRAALERRGAKVPPPAAGAALSSAEMAEWIELGQWLLDHDRRAFDRARTEIRRLVDAHATVEHGIQVISDPRTDA